MIPTLNILLADDVMPSPVAPKTEITGVSQIRPSNTAYLNAARERRMEELNSRSKW